MKPRRKPVKWLGRRNWPTLRRSESELLLFSPLDVNKRKSRQEPCFCVKFSPLFLPLFRHSLIQRLDGKSKDISKIAADITQNVSLRQGMERKKVIQHIRGLYKTDLSASRHWQELVQQLTHDRWVWTRTLFLPLALVMFLS